jgi:hypothetical protein
VSLNRRQFFGALSAAAGALFGAKKLLPNSGVAIARANRELCGSYSSVRASLEYQRAYNHALNARAEILALMPQYYYVAEPPIKLWPEPEAGERIRIQFRGGMVVGVGPADPPC